MKRILITAFEPFGGERVNPAETILRELPAQAGGAEVEKLLLPVEYEGSVSLLLQRIDASAPDAVMLLGQAGGRNAITPERLAVNVDHAAIADNAGDFRIDARIRPEAPAAYFTTLPMEAVLNAVRKVGVPCAMSVSAGAYVCNHLLYEALHYAKERGLALPIGFIHVPYLPEQVEDRPHMPSMPLADMVRGIAAAAAAVAESLA